MLSPNAVLSVTCAQALQLLEYIIKHGSERVVDDARSHLSTIKMLRNFHYIDDNGKDQGINGAPIVLVCLTTDLPPNACQSLPDMQSAIAPRNSPSFSKTLTVSVRSVEKPKPIATSIRVPVTMERASQPRPEVGTVASVMINTVEVMVAIVVVVVVVMTEVRVSGSFSESSC